MKRLLKWLLAPVVLMAAATLVPATPSEAARVRIHAGYPAYRAPYAYRYRSPYYRYRRAIWVPPPVRVRAYRPVAPVVVYPQYVPVAPPGYHVW